MSNKPPSESNRPAPGFPDAGEPRRGFAAALRGVPPAVIAEVKKVNLAAAYASADEVGKMVERAMTTLDDKGLVEMKDIALERYYQ